MYQSVSVSVCLRMSESVSVRFCAWVGVWIDVRSLWKELCVYVCVFKFNCVNEYMFVCLSLCLGLTVWMSMYVCVSVCLCLCLCVCDRYVSICNVWCYCHYPIRHLNSQNCKWGDGTLQRYIWESKQRRYYFNEKKKGREKRCMSWENEEINKRNWITATRKKKRKGYGDLLKLRKRQNKFFGWTNRWRIQYIWCFFYYHIVFSFLSVLPFFFLHVNKLIIK